MDPMGFVALSFVEMGLTTQKVKTKYKSQSAFWRGWEKFVRAITFGRVAHANLTKSTTVGTTIYLANNYESLSDREKAQILAWGTVQAVQWRKTGYIGYVLLQALPLPLFLAYGRYYLLRMAAVAAGKALVFGRDDATARTLAMVVGEQFAESMVWTWPFKKRVASEVSSRIIPQPEV